MPIDYKKYPKNWKSEIVPRILERAKNKCENCNISNGSKAYSIKLKLQDNDGRYKFRTVWIINDSDYLRIKPLARSEIKKIKVVLTIAHLDHDEMNYNIKDERLMAMCQLCHLNYDAKEKFKRRQKQL